MNEQIIQHLRDLNFDSLLELLSHQPPWWVYLLAALIPFSLFIVLRETLCWFYKINRISSRLARIEASLQRLEARENQQITPTPEHNEGPFKL